MVRERLPRIGLGTVYRNLDLLAEKGIIKKIEVGGEQKRFDGDTSAHYHIRCVECNRVEDIFIERRKELEKNAASCCSYKILDHHVQFSGICNHCLPDA
jgi:Fur family ferric uptake transcriptional regulator